MKNKIIGIAIGFFVGLMLVALGAATQTWYVISLTQGSKGGYAVPYGMVISGTSVTQVTGLTGLATTVTGEVVKISKNNGGNQITLSSQGFTVGSTTGGQTAAYPNYITVTSSGSGITMVGNTGAGLPYLYMSRQGVLVNLFQETDGTLKTDNLFNAANIAKTNAWSATKCEWLANSGSASTLNQNCSANMKVTGGGCDCGSNSVLASGPVAFTGWNCTCSASGTISVYAICCSSN